MDLALKTGCPMIGINDSGGARIQEGVVALGLYGEIFRRNVLASGVIPQISLIMGPCAGGAVYSPAITDFTVMVDQTSHMFITGPDVIKTVTGEDVEFEELGGARTHNTKSGVAHYMGTDEDDAIELRQGAAVLPAVQQPRRARRLFDARHRPRDHRRRPRLDTLIPDSANQPYDMHTVIETRPRRRRVPRGAAAVRAEHPRRLRPGRGPLGRASSPTSRCSSPARLDIDASEKAARFVRTCDAFNIPVLTFVDVPGFLPGDRPGVERHHPTRRQADLRLRRGHRPAGHRHHPQGLRRRVRRHGLQAPRRRRQPRLAHRADRRHGRAGRRQHPAPQGARRGRRRRRRARGRAHRRLRGHPANPYIAAERGYVDAVIAPSETRADRHAPCARCAPSARPCRPRSTGTSRCERRRPRRRRHRGARTSAAAHRARRPDTRGAGCRRRRPWRGFVASAASDAEPAASGARAAATSARPRRAARTPGAPRASPADRPAHPCR